MKDNFFKNHADTLAIVAVNIALITIMLTLWISTYSRIDSINMRMDTMIALIYQESRDFHGRLCSIEESNKEKR